MIPVRHRRRRPATVPRSAERGTVIIESAFAIPIFFLLVFGLVDIGLGVLQKSQATNAAADGARAGIVSYAQADVVGSSDYEAIRKAVATRLPGQEFTLLRPRCRSSANAYIECRTAGENDRLEVKVRWTWQPISPMGYAVPTQTITGSSTMGIIPRPCVPSDVAADNPGFPVCPSPIP